MEGLVGSGRANIYFSLHPLSFGSTHMLIQCIQCAEIRWIILFINGSMLLILFIKKRNYVCTMPTATPATVSMCARGGKGEGGGRD